jgi:hypothetical protein
MGRVSAADALPRRMRLTPSGMHRPVDLRDGAEETCVGEVGDGAAALPPMHAVDDKKRRISQMPWYR